MRKSQISVMMLCFLAVVTLGSFKSMKEHGPSAKVDAMVKNWERAKAYTQEYLNATTEEVIAFKPTPEMRTFGQQMLHLAEANYGFGSAASGKASPVSFGALEKASDQYKTKEALSKAVMDSYDFVIAALRDMDETRMTENIKMFNRFELTRDEAFQKAFEHQTHHRGQTTVYLRLKGVTPPNEKLF
ncbi:MAG: DinB family protein [Bacteroidota bacterium]|nr:DinB family protein [Bacteroidota bacterium]